MKRVKVEVRKVTGHDRIGPVGGYVVVCHGCPETYFAGTRVIADGRARNHRGDCEAVRHD